MKLGYSEFRVAFLAPKVALEMQMSVCHKPWVRSSTNFFCGFYCGISNAKLGQSCPVKFQNFWKMTIFQFSFLGRCFNFVTPGSNLFSSCPIAEEYGVILGSCRHLWGVSYPSLYFVQLYIDTNTRDGMVWVLLHHSIAIVIYTSVFKWVQLLMRWEIIKSHLFSAAPLNYLILMEYSCNHFLNFNENLSPKPLRFEIRLKRHLNLSQDIWLYNFKCDYITLNCHTCLSLYALKLLGIGFPRVSKVFISVSM